MDNSKLNDLINSALKNKKQFFNKILRMILTDTNQFIKDNLDKFIKGDFNDKFDIPSIERIQLINLDLCSQIVI